MNEFTKMIVPIVLTLMLSGLGTSVYDLYAKVNRVSDTLKENTKYAVIIQQLRKEADDMEQRLRKIERSKLCKNQTENDNEKSNFSTTNRTAYVGASH